MDVEFLENYLKEHPDSIMFARLADSYLGMKRVDEAIQVCEDGIKKHPYYATGHFVLAKSYMANSLFEQAEKEFKRVLLFDPKYLGAHKLYGDLMREIGWDNTYHLSYKKIMQYDPLEVSAKEVVTENDEKTAEHESTKDLSEFSLASSEKVPSPDKTLDQQEHDWSQGSDWPEQPTWPEDTEITEKSGSPEEAGWEDEIEMSKPAQEESKGDISAEMEETQIDPTEEGHTFTPPSAFDSESVQAPEPEPKPEPKPLDDDFEVLENVENKSKESIDFDAISPVPVSEDEEDLVFGTEVTPEIEPEKKPDKENITAKPEGHATDKVTEVDEDKLAKGDVDDKDVEEFSYILEDIFKDDASEEKDKVKGEKGQLTQEDAKSALDKEAESFMKNFQAFEDEDESGEEMRDEEAEKTKEDDFPDFSKPPQSQDAFDLPEPAKPAFSPPPSKTQEPLSSEDDIESEEIPEPEKATSSSKKKSDKIVTPTLGEIYAAQGQYAKAIDVFEGLLKKHPENESYNNKIQMLKKKLEEAANG